MTLQGWARTGADSLGGPGIRQILPALPAGRPARLTSACRTPGRQAGLCGCQGGGRGGGLVLALFAAGAGADGLEHVVDGGP